VTDLLGATGFSARGARRGTPGSRVRVDFNVWSRKKRIEKLNYMHINPVKRCWQLFGAGVYAFVH
jgi:hypothetical protein